MSSSRSYRSSKSNFEHLQVWNNLARSTFQPAQKEISHGEETSENENLPKTSDEEERADSMNQIFQHFQAVSNPGKNGLAEKIKELEQIRQQTINQLLQWLFGYRYTEAQSDSQASPADDSGIAYPLPTFQAVPHTGGHFTSFSSYYEAETTQFQTQGTVITADGREISFDVEVSMSRSFYQSVATEIDFGDPRFRDPLVINLDGTVAGVSDQKFFFDIDADGQADEISRLSAGNGYLALDKNEDWMINDGGELFGTASGNGFADLAAYDSDHNGWIDEADAIWDKLKIWCTDAEGQETLYTLADVGVGALYLGSTDTEFSLKNADNQTEGVIRRSGLFLYENGRTGTLQQMDLAT